jgi:alcohol dehydrogenase
MTRDPGVLRPPSTILLGEGTIEALGETVAPLGRRVLVCTDEFLARNHQVDAVRRVLAEANLEVEILDAAVPELPRASVEGAIDAARALRPDCVVGLGGGSCLDLAKLVALGLSVDQPLDAFYGEMAVPGPILPLAAVPTTAGTGSEVTPVAVLSDPAIALKVGISSPFLVPRAAICDPALSMGAPASVTAFAGIDALAHAIEAYCAVRRHDWSEMAGRVFVGGNVLSDRFALHAAALVSRSLRGAIEDDPGARAEALEGSLCAGLAFATAGTALAHALQYPLGALTGTPHGMGVGLLMPFVMAFNAPARTDRLAELAVGMGAQASAAGAIEAARRLALDVGIPGSLADMGAAAGDLERIAEQGLTVRRLVMNNPTPVSLEDALELLRRAFDGDLAIPTTT